MGPSSFDLALRFVLLAGFVISGEIAGGILQLNGNLVMLPHYILEVC